MVEIRTTSDGRYMLDCDGILLEKSFFRIERLADKSNYYLLWEDEDMDVFYLYNTEKNIFALKASVCKNAQTFRKVDFYSEETQSFVAYRSDEEYAHILYDDGDMERYAFQYVGEEHNGMRPVKTYGGKWLYYDAQRRKPTWAIEKGYNLKDGEALGRKLDRSHFIVYGADGSCNIRKYDENLHKVTYLNDRYDFIEEIIPSFFVGKLRWKDLYELFVCDTYLKPIGYYDSKPMYDAANKVFYARKEDVWCIIRNRKELYNNQWTTCNFRFHGAYIFYQAASDKAWQVFDGNNSMELCPHWKNIRLYDSGNEAYLLADTDQGKDCKISVDEIGQYMREWLELLATRSKALYAQDEWVQSESSVVEHENSKQPYAIESPTSAAIQEEDALATNMPEISEQQLEYPNEWPNHIEYCTTIEHVHIAKDRYLICGRNYNMVSAGEHICWIVRDRNALVITRYMPNKAHKVIYCKTYDKGDDTLKRLLLPAKTLRVDMKGISEERFVKELDRQISLGKEKKQDSVSANEQTITTESTSNEVALETQVQAFDTRKGNKIYFQFDGKDYWLGAGDVWKGGEAFQRRNYLLKKDLLAILLDSSNVVCIDYKRSVNLHYQIIGEGKDARFDQDFGPTNKAIRDNSRRILLFTESNGEIRFLDEVLCSNYSLVEQEPATGHGRKLILFDLISKTQRNPWHIVTKK